MKNQIVTILLVVLACPWSVAQNANSHQDCTWENAMIDTKTFADSFQDDQLGELENSVRNAFSNLPDFTVIYDPELRHIGKRTKVNGKCHLGTWCDMFAECIGAYCMKTPKGPHFFALRRFCCETGKIAIKGHIEAGKQIEAAVLFRLEPNGTARKVDDFIVDRNGRFLALVSVPGEVVSIWDGKRSFRIRTETAQLRCFVFADGRFSRTNSLADVEWNKTYAINFTFDGTGDIPVEINQVSTDGETHPTSGHDPFFAGNGDFSWNSEDGPHVQKSPEVESF